MRWISDAVRRARGCPPGWKLVRSLSEAGSDLTIQAHLLACARCADEIEGLRAVATRAQAFPPPRAMSNESRNAISLRLLATPGRAPSAARRRAGLVFVTATAVVVFVVVGLSRRPPRVVVRPHLATRSVTATTETATATETATETATATATGTATGTETATATSTATGTATSTATATSIRSRASIRAIGAARFTRVQPAPDDVVRLDEGTIVLEVAPLPPGERFRVRTADAEVEVRGTRFQVSAAGGELLAVSVSRGRVEVKSPGGGRAVLEAGDDWVRGSPTVAAMPGTASRTAAQSPSRAAGARSDRSDLPSTDVHAARSAASARASFERAWSLLRQGNPKDAAKLFAEVETLARGAGIAEDALYWRAVALTRTGDLREARRIFGDFLGRFPASVHHGEAATALGWLLLDGGDAEAARQAFTQAIDDPSQTVRDSARDGLARASRP